MNTKSWDVIVVGGGLVGSSCAYQLAKSGLKTLLLDKGELASGASGPILAMSRCRMLILVSAWI